MESVLLIVSQFNTHITEPMYQGATEYLKSQNVTTHRVDAPGAFELPFLAKSAALTKKWQGIICLGCVIRGETPHFDYVCQEAARGIGQVGLETGIPCIFGVLTTDTEDQARARSGQMPRTPGGSQEKPLVENKGVDCAQALLLTLKSLRTIKESG